MCMDILGDDTPEGRWTLWYDDIVGGTSVSYSNKALLQCNEVEVLSINSLLYVAWEVRRQTQYPHLQVL